MKELKVKVLKFDLPAFTRDVKCIIQIGKIGDLPDTGPELVSIKGTELNEFEKNPIEDYIKKAIEKQYNPLLEHKNQIIGEVVFKKAKLTEDKSK